MPSCDVHGEFVDTIVEFLDQEGWDKGFSVKGYTSCKLNLDGQEVRFRCTTSFHHDGEWFDWCLVKYMVDGGLHSSTTKYYPG